MTTTTNQRSSQMKKDGGPAFACAADNGHQSGMSLRDYFAAAALSVAHLTASVQCPLSTRAYEIADAMLIERENTSPTLG